MVVADGTVFEASDAVMMKHSKLLHDMMVPDDEDEVMEENPTVPLPGVEGPTLARIIAWCVYNDKDPLPSFNTGPKEEKKAPKIESLAAFHAKFVQDLVPDDLFDLILGANLLDIDSLMDLGCLGLALRLRGRTPDEIRTLLNIEPITPAEEEKVRAENQWLFEMKLPDLT